MTLRWRHHRMIFTSTPTMTWPWQSLRKHQIARGRLYYWKMLIWHILWQLFIKSSCSVFAIFLVIRPVRFLTIPITISAFKSNKHRLVRDESTTYCTLPHPLPMRDELIINNESRKGGNELTFSERSWRITAPWTEIHQEVHHVSSFYVVFPSLSTIWTRFWIERRFVLEWRVAVKPGSEDTV